MIAEINESKTLNLMVENVTQIKRGIKINVGASVKIKKNIVCTKKIIFGILLHLVTKMSNIIDNSVIACDEIIDAGESKTIPQNLMKKI